MTHTEMPPVVEMLLTARIYNILPLAEARHTGQSNQRSITALNAMLS